MQDIQETRIETTQDESRKEQTIAAILSTSALQPVDWRMLMQEGVMVRLSIRRCRFQAKLELADIGVAVQDVRVHQAIARTLVLGEKRLLPKGYLEALSRIESSARRLLTKYSFHTELGAFLPVTAYETWKRETEKCKARYFALRDEIIQKHEDLVVQILEEYRIVARDTYRRIQEVSSQILPESEETFVAEYCKQIVALIPDQRRIQESFGFEIELIDGVKRMEEVEGDQPDASAASQGQRIRLRGPVGERTWQRTQMQRDLFAQAQDKKQKTVDAFLTTIVTQLRSLIYDAVTDVLASIEQRRDGKFPPRSVTQLKRLVEQISQLNFYGDQELEQSLARIQAILDQQPADRERNLPAIREKLRALATVTRAALLDLEQNPRSARALDVPDMPTEANRRQARVELGLDREAIVFLQSAQGRTERMVKQVPLFDWADEQGQRGERFVSM